MALLVGALILALAGGVAVGIALAGDSPEIAQAGETPGSSQTTTPTPDSSPGTKGDTGSSPAPSTSPPVRSGACEDLPLGEPFLSGPTAQAVDLGEVNGVRVEGVVYPRPDYEGNPWSQWGQGLALDDGRFYSAIGDHIGADGNSYVYEYDSASGSLAMVGDLLSYVDHQSGSWGYGKVHGQMVAGACGEIYFSSYWGSFNDIRFDDSYRGDLLFRLDPHSRTIDPLTVPVDQHGQP